MGYRSTFWRTGVADRIFECEPATWLQAALPESFVRGPMLTESFVRSTVQHLAQTMEPPVLDEGHGFNEFRRLLQLEGRVADDLYLEAISSTVASVMKAGEQLSLCEYGFPRRKFERSSLFQTCLCDSEDQVVMGSNNHEASVLTFSIEEDGIGKSKCLVTVGANKIMSRNPCRRYIYGLSFDGCMATLWRFDRLSVLVSKAFNFQKTPHFLVHMILFLGLARKDQLGIDPTVYPVEKKDDEDFGPDRFPSFVYQLGRRRYRTIGRPIYNNPATILCSHGTRAWAVREVDESNSWIPGTTQHVLKDFWADENRPHDSECQAAIRRRLQLLDKDGGHRAEEINAYFLNIRHEEDMVVSNGQLDVTLKIPDDAMQADCAWTSSGNYDHCASYETPFICYSGLGNFSSPRSPSARLHRRLLFEEKCLLLTDYTELTIILECFKQFSNALNLFRQAAYVHRDISVGNCLVHEQNGRVHAKICDLEFCQDYASVSSADAIMGTREFMATETTTKRLAWCPNGWSTYHYHFLHDLEALYWLLLWIVLGHEPKECTLEPADETYITWREEFRLLFSRSSRPTDVTQIYLARRLFMLDDYDQGFINWSRVFRKQALPSTDLFRPIFDIRLEWMATYTALEKTQQDAATGLWPSACFTEDLYNTFYKMVDQVIAGIPEGGIQIRSILQKLYEYYKKEDTVILP